jgi:hypothetical protein
MWRYIVQEGLVNNADVIKMVRAGLHDVEIIAAIWGSVAMYRLAPEDLQKLAASGVSGEVIRAMFARELVLAEGTRAERD